MSKKFSHPEKYSPKFQEHLSKEAIQGLDLSLLGNDIAIDSKERAKEEAKVDIEIVKTQHLMNQIDFAKTNPKKIFEGLDMQDPRVREFMSKEFGIDLDSSII